MTGWIAIDRGIFEHEFFASEPMSEREAWVWIISRAAWKDTRHRIGIEMVSVPRGAFMTTLREMQSAWLWRSDTRVRTFLRRLENDKMIEVKTNAKGNAQKTQISVCNYEVFQSIERTENAKKNAPETHGKRTKETREQETTEDEAKASAKKRGSRLPDDWFLPMTWGQWAINEGYSQDAIRTEADNFKDYWRARAGPTASKLDWEATWRIWMRKAPKGELNGKRNYHGGNAAPESRDRFLDEIAEVARARPTPRLVGS